MYSALGVADFFFFSWSSVIFISSLDISSRVFLCVMSHLGCCVFLWLVLFLFFCLFYFLFLFLFFVFVFCFLYFYFIIFVQLLVDCLSIIFSTIARFLFFSSISGKVINLFSFFGQIYNLVEFILFSLTQFLVSSSDCYKVCSLSDCASFLPT